MRAQRTEKPWTDADIAQVRKRWNGSTASAGEIAREMGRTRNSICGLIHRFRDQFNDRSQMARALRNKHASAESPKIGRVSSSFSAEEFDVAVRLWRTGMPIRDMAERLGKSLSSLKHMIMKNRARFPKRYDDSGAGRRLTTIALRGPAKVAPSASRLAGASDALFTGEGIPLLKLNDHVCHYPVSGEKAATLFCGAAADHGSWCHHHAGRVFEARAA